MPDRDQTVGAIVEAARTAVDALADDYDARLATLKAEYDAYRETHPDTPPESEPEPQPVPAPAGGQVFGTSYGGADESHNHGRAQVARIFYQGDLPANPYADADFRKAYDDGARAFVLSWKGGQAGAAIKAALADPPQGATIYGCYWHEPEDNIGKTISLATYRSRHAEHASAMREVGVVPVTILMQYTLVPGSNRDVSDYYTGDDGFMFDAYMNPAKGKDDPEKMVDRMVEAAQASGARFSGLGETGLPSSVALNTAIELTKRMKAKLVATPYMRVNCYWPSGDFKFRNEAHADAWFK